MSGRPDFDVGDLVVCVDDAPLPGLFNPPPLSRKGQVVRVAQMVPPEMVHRNIWAFRATGEHDGKLLRAAYRFRRIDPKPPEFWTGTIDADAGDQVPA